MAKWNSTISKDREQISLSPGSDNSSVNFAWYTKKASGIQKLKIAENKRLTNAKVYEAKQTEAVTDKDDTAYVSNKVTATDLRQTQPIITVIRKMDSGQHQKNIQQIMEVSSALSL